MASPLLTAAEAQQDGSFEGIYLTVPESGSIGAVLGWVLGEAHSKMEMSCWKSVRENSHPSTWGRERKEAGLGRRWWALASPMGSLEAGLAFQSSPVALRGQGLYPPESTARWLARKWGSLGGTVAVFSPCNS